jgi:thioredoxin reductase (NADPH)
VSLDPEVRGLRDLLPLVAEAMHPVEHAAEARATALFVIIGARPRIHSFKTALQLDSSGYIITGPELGPDARRREPWTTLDRDPYVFEASTLGVFAAGDVRSGSIKRVASAVGEGSIAIRFVNEPLGRQASMVPQQAALAS